jgi:DNA alkylation damage repair protein AlkB
MALAIVPECFLELAIDAAAEAGYSNFVPDACLINRYEPAARLTLHQDKNEQDYSFPIVSVSLGLPAIFQFGGRSDTEICSSPWRRSHLGWIFQALLPWSANAQGR